MSDSQQFNALMARYDEHHQNRQNVLIHLVAVPSIFFSVIGLVWCLGVTLPISINITWFLLAAVVIYYFSLSVAHTIVMIVTFAVFMGLITWLELQQMSVFWFSIVTFVVMWVFQFIGHKIEGKSPSFFEDLRFLLIGPLWWADHLVKRFR